MPAVGWDLSCDCQPEHFQVDFPRRLGFLTAWPLCSITSCRFHYCLLVQVATGPSQVQGEGTLILPLSRRVVRFWKKLWTENIVEPLLENAACLEPLRSSSNSSFLGLWQSPFLSQVKVTSLGSFSPAHGVPHVWLHYLSSSKKNITDRQPAPSPQPPCHRRVEG